MRNAYSRVDEKKILERVRFNKRGRKREKGKQKIRSLKVDGKAIE